jgi:hypothetical protein
MKVTGGRFVACALSALAVAPTPARAADPMPSWSEGASKQAIVKFVADVTQQGAPTFVPPAERIALDEATAKGWTVVDMKKDWSRIYPFDK